jgi:uroporphyrinogen-III decarboxylase
MDWWQAYERFGMDFAIYVSPTYGYDEKDLANWNVKRRDLGWDDSGNRLWEETICTPKGELHHAGVISEITPWETEDLIKDEKDFEIWNEFLPLPASVDLTKLKSTKERLGDRGIIRSHPFSAGQGSPWQSFCILAGTEQAILWTFDKPEFVHHALKAILEKTLYVTRMWEGTPADMVETGGGAGSNTVISPDLAREYCLPYDQKQHALFRELGVKSVYHLCGGLMKMLDIAVKNGADGLETMTPPSMGGDCDLREVSRQVGDRLFFIGGFDQNAGFEHGSPEAARRLVHECFEATRDHGGYVIAPSDHFFHGDPACIQAFADAARECRY